MRCALVLSSGQSPHQSPNLSTGRRSRWAGYRRPAWSTIPPGIGAINRPAMAPADWTATRSAPAARTSCTTVSYRGCLALPDSISATAFGEIPAAFASCRWLRSPARRTPLTRELTREKSVTLSGSSPSLARSRTSRTAVDAPSQPDRLGMASATHRSDRVARCSPIGEQGLTSHTMRVDCRLAHQVVSRAPGSRPLAGCPRRPTGPPRMAAARPRRSSCGHLCGRPAPAGRR
jgi:hypothetical protein